MLGFKSFESASRALTGIEMVRTIKKAASDISLGNFLQNLLLIRCMNYIVKKSFGSYFVKCDRAWGVQLLVKKFDSSTVSFVSYSRG
jgi:hypothetical protein